MTDPSQLVFDESDFPGAQILDNSLTYGDLEKRGYYQTRFVLLLANGSVLSVVTTTIEQSGDEDIVKNRFTALLNRHPHLWRPYRAISCLGADRLRWCVLHAFKMLAVRDALPPEQEAHYDDLPTPFIRVVDGSEYSHMFDPVAIQPWTARIDSMGFDPSPSLWSHSPFIFDQDLLFILSPTDEWMIDVGWYGREHGGAYRIVVGPGWEEHELFFSIECYSVAEVKRCVLEIMDAAKRGELP
jgi:hypothetical protein